MSKIIINGKSDGALKAYKDGSEIGAMCAGGAVAYIKMDTGSQPEPPAGPSCLCFTAEQSGSTVGMGHYGTNASTTKPVIYISTDGASWILWDYTTITLANAGDKVYMYGNNPNGVSNSEGFNYSKFVMTGSIAASGDCSTLISRDGSGNVSNYGFYSLFQNCAALTSAPELPSLTLGIGSYERMFQGCTAITTAPSLPATAIDNHCYYEMFSGCTALTTAPATLPAMTLKVACYRAMFYGCTNLANAPELPAMTLVNNCYNQMFCRCTSLTTAPELPATVMDQRCYYQMFSGCTGLTSGPDLRHVTSVYNESCGQMFTGCANLNKAYAPTVSSWDTSVFSNWLGGVAASGTLYVKTFTMHVKVTRNSTSGCPSGWSVSIKAN